MSYKNMMNIFPERGPLSVKFFTTPDPFLRSRVGGRHGRWTLRRLSLTGGLEIETREDHGEGKEEEVSR